ncbi:MAG: hypothetical protein R3D00_06870 [Bacteroidia bacterium]
MNHKLKYIILGLQLVILLVPAAYIALLPSQIGEITIVQLSGSFYPTKKLPLKLDTWFSGQYVSRMNEYAKENYPVRPWFVRANNQLDYSLFNHSANQRIVVGKNGELYDKTYIDAWLGKDLIANDSAESLVRKIANLQDYLQPFNTRVLVITPPGKPTFMPEMIPGHYLKNPQITTNREQFTRLLDQYHVPNIDYSQFPEVQKETDIRLYPRTGLHWSHWGAAIAADSMRSKALSLTGLYLPEMTYSPQTYYQRNDTDWEVERAMNLLFAIPGNQATKPVYNFSATDTTQQKPKVIVIGDSYYKIWYDQGLHEKLFHPQSQFWYYGLELLPHREINGERASVMSLDVIEEMKQADLIILLNAEINLPRLGFEVWEKIIF